MWVWEIAGGGYFGGRGRGYPTPRNFLDKKCYFWHILPKFEFIGPQRFWGSVPPPLGVPSPLKICCNWKMLTRDNAERSAFTARAQLLVLIRDSCTGTKWYLYQFPTVCRTLSLSPSRSLAGTIFEKLRSSVSRRPAHPSSQTVVSYLPVINSRQNCSHKNPILSNGHWYFW